uniref:Lipocalin 15 n=1 Tax=Rhipicephalus microplus TaxID=6941 RepID=A0A034WYY5_RHIMP
MANVTKREFGTLLALFLVLAEVFGEGKDPSDTSVVDAFKIFRTLPHGTTIFDMDGDGDLDCVTAVRTEFSEDPLETTYVLLFKGLGGKEPRNVSFHIKPGRTPDRTQFTVDDDYDFVQHARFHYTNYQNCAAMEQPFRGVRECVLWTTQDTFREMPEDCMLEYRKSCKDAVKPYDEESCAEFVL